MKPCSHATPKLILTKPIQLYVGNGPAPTGAIILDLADRSIYRPAIIARGVKLPKGLVNPVLSFNWPDMSVPSMTTDTWRALAAWLKTQGSPVFVACIGAHGRTGTAVAILASLWSQVPKDMCPVTWIREKHCEEAIESQAQLTYIEQITGRTVTAKPAKSYLVPESNKGTGSWCPKSTASGKYCWLKVGHDGPCDETQRSGKGTKALPPTQFECGKGLTSGKTCNRFPGHQAECARLPIKGEKL